MNPSNSLSSIPSLALCECGHPLEDHAWSGWGEHTVCVVELDDESAGWYGVCPCVRRDDEETP